MLISRKSTAQHGGSSPAKTKRRVSIQSDHALLQPRRRKIVASYSEALQVLGHIAAANERGDNAPERRRGLYAVAALRHEPEEARDPSVEPDHRRLVGDEIAQAGPFAHQALHAERGRLL